MYAGTMVGRNIFLLTRTNIFFMISINMYTETSDSLSFRLLPSIDSLIDSSESANEVRVGIYYEKRGNDIIRTKNHYAACINYQWFETHLLPRPYDTDCNANESSSYRSRTRCFEECIKKRSTELFSLLPQGVHIFYPETVAYPIANSSFLQTTGIYSTEKFMSRSMPQSRLLSAAFPSDKRMRHCQERLLFGRSCVTFPDAA